MAQPAFKRCQICHAVEDNISASCCQFCGAPFTDPNAKPPITFGPDPKPEPTWKTALLFVPRAFASVFRTVGAHSKPIEMMILVAAFGIMCFLAMRLITAMNAVTSTPWP